jgi:hypothetical protein
MRRKVRALTELLVDHIGPRPSLPKLQKNNMGRPFPVGGTWSICTCVFSSLHSPVRSPIFPWLLARFSSFPKIPSPRIQICYSPSLVGSSQLKWRLHIQSWQFPGSSKFGASDRVGMQRELLLPYLVSKSVVWLELFSIAWLFWLNTNVICWISICRLKIFVYFSHTLFENFICFA